MHRHVKAKRLRGLEIDDELIIATMRFFGQSCGRMRRQRCNGQMTIFAKAVRARVISAADLERLTTFLSKHQPAAPANAAAAVVKFDAAHLLWYAGALIVIGAMGIFSTVAFSQMGGRALTVCAIIYAIAFTLAGHHLWHRKNLQIPGGLLITVAVSMAPLAVYGIQDELGWWGSFGKPGTVGDFYVWM